MNRLYYSLPVPLQNLYHSGVGLAYKLAKERRLFWKILDGLERTQFSSGPDLEALQDESVRNLVRYCHENSPYYKELFRAHRISPADVRGVGDLHRIPFTTKEDIRRDPERFISRKYRKGALVAATTSGTTGMPLTLYRDPYSITYENAMIWRQYRWGGIVPGDRIATLRGKLVQKIDDMRPPFWRYDRVLGKILLSSYHLSRETIRPYHAAMAEFRPKAVEAYPSAVYGFVRLAEAEGLPPVRVRAVYTSSETLHPHQRAAVEAWFGCTVYDLYGNAERVAALGTCPERRWHVFSEYGVVEAIPREYQGNRFHELVGTPFINLAMPILRYCTGDILHPATDRNPCPCGRGLPLVAGVESLRVDEAILTRDGRRLQSVEQMSEGLRHVIEFQLVQEAIDRVAILIVPEEGFSEEDERLVLRQASERIGTEFSFEIRKVDSIPRTGRGKYRYIVNRMEDRHGGSREES